MDGDGKDVLILASPEAADACENYDPRLRCPRRKRTFPLRGPVVDAQRLTNEKTGIGRLSDNKSDEMTPRIEIAAM